MSDYNIQAINFLTKTNTTFKVEFLKNDYHFQGDEEKRDIYKITLERGQRKYIFNFGQSINGSGFYYTKGVEKTNIPRNFSDKSDYVLLSYIKKSDCYFLNNGKSDKIVRPIVPNEYDVLACLTTYDHETLEDFCDNFGYDVDSINIDKIYKAVADEYKNVCMLWNNEEIELLQEIK